jgi:uncharacterized membrane protein
MDWPQFVVQWLHVLLAIIWFGAALTTNLIFIPAITKLPLDRQREVAGSYGAVASRILNIVAPIVIVLGVIRGTAFGPIRSLDALTTAYGVTWLVALVAALLTWAWARFRIEPALARMNAIPVETAILPDGSISPEMDAAVSAAKRNAALELIGFFIVFTCMILMRFGY